LATDSDTLLAAVAQVSRELLCGLATAAPSTDGQHTTGIELSGKFTALTSDVTELVDSDDLVLFLLSKTGAQFAASMPVTEVTTELVHDKDDLATVVLSTSAVMIPDSVTLLGVVNEDSTKLVDVADSSSTTGADDEFTAMTADSVMLPAALTEVNTELVAHGVEDFEISVLSTNGGHASDSTTLSGKLTPLTSDSAATVSGVISELVHGNDDLATVVLVTTEADGELTDEMTASMTDSVTLLAAVNEVSTELVDGDADLATAVLHT